MSQYAALYNTNRWKQRSKRQRRREPLCARCKAAGRIVLADVADHVVRHNGNVELFWHGALQSLCFSCHDSSKQSMEKLGYDKQAIDDSGWPTDSAHFANRRIRKT